LVPDGRSADVEPKGPIRRTRLGAVALAMWICCRATAAYYEDFANSALGRPAFPRRPDSARPRQV